jgi:nucleoside-diphosphate-sugar epimerase
MRSLVTGATGFVGSHLAEVLRERGHDVRLLVRSESRLAPELRSGFEIVKGDVTQPAAELRKAADGCEYVFHVAGLIRGRTQADFDAVNAEGTRNICEAAKLAGNAKRVVCVSSQAAVGPSRDANDLVSEDREPKPVTFYGRSKLKGELIAREYGKDFGVTIVRPPVVYGPRDTATLEFFKWMSKGYSLRFGNPDKAFSMIHGRDLSRGIADAAMHEAAAGETFFVTDAEPYRMERIMELLREILKPSKNRAMNPPVWLAKAFARINDIIQVITRRPMLPNSDKMKELLPPYWLCSGEKAKRVFGFESQINVRDGLAETGEWYLKQGWIKVN